MKWKVRYWIVCRPEFHDPSMGTTGLRQIYQSRSCLLANTVGILAALLGPTYTMPETVARRMHRNTCYRYRVLDDLSGTGVQ